MDETLRAQLNLIAQTIFDKKGFNILALDVRSFSTLSDIYIIAEGTVDRHLRALSSAIIEAVGAAPIRHEGEKEGEWVVIDYGDIIIHLMVPDIREKYSLEELWKEGAIVDITINIPDRKTALK